MKTSFIITVDVNYPSISDHGQRHTIELGETRTAIQLVVDELRNGLFLDKKDSFETIGAAKVEYTYKAIHS